ncbi:MAG: hypothetical protein AAF903_10660 [Pseudomonadota bacterium]
MADAANEEYWTINMVLENLPIGRTSLYKLRQQGDFPPCYSRKLVTRMLRVYKRSEVEAWWHSRIGDGLPEPTLEAPQVEPGAGE